MCVSCDMRGKCRGLRRRVCDGWKVSWKRALRVCMQALSLGDGCAFRLYGGI